MANRGQTTSLRQLRLAVHVPGAYRFPLYGGTMLHRHVSLRINALAVLLASSTVLGARVPAAHADTATPITHVVVIFQENVSFDHYFGTYPQADNPQGEPAFQARPGTPGVNGLTDGLLDHNPNAANP